MRQKIVRREVRRRGFFGQFVKVIFIGFNGLMLFWLLSYYARVGDNLAYAKSVGASAGANLGVAIGTGIALAIWALGAVILGIFVLLTRGSTVVIEEME